MVTNVEFARLVARPVDRAHIAASVAPGRDALSAIAGYEVPPIEAAFVASFLDREGMTWDQLCVPLRYAPEKRVRTRLQQCVDAGVITFEDDFIAYTEAGFLSAQAVLDARAAEMQQRWSNTPRAVTSLAASAAPVAEAATQSAGPSSRIVDNAVAATTATDASTLWRLLAKIRRFWADCHFQAWTEAGHSIDSIRALAVDARARQPIEHRTDELNAAIWSRLPEESQLTFMANLASLDGAGTPT